MLFKLSYLNSNFALTLGYLNPALNNPAQGFFSACSHCRSSQTHTYPVISSKVLIAFARFVVKSMGLIMAFVVFLERLVITGLEGPITNDQFLSCTSASIATAWCAKSFWDWTTFLVFQIRQEFTNSRELTFSLVRWTQLRQETWWYGSSSYLGLPKWIKRIVHFLEKANVQPRGLYQPMFTGFKIYYQIVSRQSNCKMVWT